MQSPILIVEDEIKIAELLRDYCIESGFEVQMIHNGREAQEWLQQHRPRLILLDLMLPEVDGITICKEFRRNSDIPVIMVTAKVEEIDRLLGLELGADDYICKPFSPREVMARIKSVLRRVERIAQPYDDLLLLNENSYTVSYKESKIELTAVEFKLFQMMYKHPGQIFSREQLMNNIYDDNRIVGERTIDSHIKKLRKKLVKIGTDEDVVRSVYGAGYNYQGL